MFSKFGDTFTFDANLFSTIERFVCDLYNAKSCVSCDEARYFKFYSKKGTVPEPQQLPATSDALICHSKRVSYFTFIIKRSLSAYPDIPLPDGHGWTLKDGILETQWMLRRPAPDAILDLVSCHMGCHVLIFVDVAMIVTINCVNSDF